MKGRLVVAAFALLLCVAFPVLAQPHPPGGPHGGPGPMHLEGVLRALDLTTAQSTAIDTLMKTRRDAEDALRPTAEAAHEALGDQLRAATLDEAAIRAKAAVVAGLDADRMVADATLLRDVRALLTDTQRQKLDRLLEPPAPPADGPGGGRGPRK
jgi:Spy/CpxP family protein refolding chaperone